jgi:hypothetical protein
MGLFAPARNCLGATGRRPAARRAAVARRGGPRFLFALARSRAAASRHPGGLGESLVVPDHWDLVADEFPIV